MFLPLAWLICHLCHPQARPIYLHHHLWRINDVGGAKHTGDLHLQEGNIADVAEQGLKLLGLLLLGRLCSARQVKLGWPDRHWLW